MSIQAWSALRNNRRMDALWEQQDGRCWYCGCEVAHSTHWRQTADGYVLDGAQRHCSIDHQTPKCQGGSNRPENLVLACTKCNSQKSGKSVAQYRAWCAVEAFYGEGE